MSLNGNTTVTGANTLTTTTGLTTLGGGLTVTGGTAMIGNGGTTVHIVSQDAGGPTQSATGTGIGTGGSCVTTGNQSDTAGVLHTAYYATAQSVQGRLGQARAAGLGVGLWRLGDEDQETWNIPSLNL